MTDTPQLPVAIDARLPATYETAKRALSECSRIDECKDWADKAQALASYAKQAKDSTLHNMALRIQNRAMRRVGELLKQVRPAHGANQNIQDGAVPKVTRGAAAEDAGLSERQRKTALRVANVPEPVFTAAVESPLPPTTAKLAAMGTTHRPATETPAIAPDHGGAAEAQSLMRNFSAFCGTHDPVAVAAAALDPDLMRGFVASVDCWLDCFVTHLPVSDEEWG